MSDDNSNITTALKESIEGYFNIELGDFYVSSAHRWLVYALTFILVGLFTFVGLTIYAAINPLIKIPLTFKGMYAWHTAISFSICLAMVDMLAALTMKRLWGYSRRTVGKVWVILLAAYMLGFLSQRTLVYQLVSLYAPAMLWIHELNPSQRPGIISTFVYILPFWLVICFSVMQIVLKKQAQAQELFRVRIDAILEDRQRPGPGPAPEDTNPDGNGYLPLPASADSAPILTRQVGHVTVEDHYLRIFYLIDGGLNNILIRMPLKELSERLPASHFIQVHRSHIVNLEQISRINRSGRKIQVVMKHGEFELPVSRYRVPQILPKMEEYLHAT